MSNIRDLVRQLAATPSSGAGSMILCRVDSVDTEARTVDAQPLDESAPILGVNLQANQSSEVGVVMFPRQDSYVIVGMLGMCQAVVVACDDVERVRVDVGEMSVDVSEDGIVMNGGELGGMVNVQGLTDRLNTIENDINNLREAIKSAPIGSMDGGAAFKGGLASWAGQPLSLSTNDDYEDNNVKH